MAFFGSRRHTPRADMPSRPDAWSDIWFDGTLDGVGHHHHHWGPMEANLALTLSAFWQGLRILSENVASFPCHVYERLPNGGRKVATNHPVDDVIFIRPNGYQNAFEYWEMTTAHLTLRGNMYSYIVPGKRGFIDQLWPIHPDLVTVALLPSRVLQYTIRNETTGRTEKRGAEDIFHIKGLSFDGITGVSVITYAHADLQGLLSAERFANGFWKRGATAGIAAIPETPVTDDESYTNMLLSIQKGLTGLENAGGVFVPRDKMTLQNIGFKPEDAQLLASRQYGLQHVAQWLNLHPSILGDPSTVGYASTKQFRQNLVDLTFRPLVERIEAAVDADLFLNPQRFFCKFNMSALLRGDPTEQANVQHTNVVDGVWTRNEARLKQDMNPLPGLDEPLAPMNMGPGGNSRSSVAAITRAQLMTLDKAKLLVRAEIGAAKKAAVQHAGDAEAWQGWLREHYAKHAQVVAEGLRMPLVLAREYAAKQGTQLAEQGVGACEDWEASVPVGLANLALCADVEGRAFALDQEAA